jgi:hypothetical protein
MGSLSAGTAAESESESESKVVEITEYESDPALPAEDWPGAAIVAAGIAPAGLPWLDGPTDCNVWGNWTGPAA